jgi:NAD(P)H-dependent flavin oxidoreductase YrpB (nitropropane dioxygenase family)
MEETGTQLVERGRVRIRALRTELVEKLIQGAEDAGQVFAGHSLEESWVKGDLDAGLLPAGEVSGLISKVLSVKEVIAEMVS